jgi:NDP-sugar pyrophosphorylase family protein
MTVFVLAGGLGTRIAGLHSGLPKAMIPVGNRPFIDHVLEQLDRTGVGNVVVCAGHKASMIVDHVERLNRPGLRVVVEPEPRGTAGALAFARRAVDHGDETFLAINGDTWTEFEPEALLAEHKRLAADATLACYEVDEAEARGTVAIREDGTIASFREKAVAGPGWVSGGVYALEPSALADVPDDRATSLETDVFPALLARHRTLGAWRAPGRFWDMGTPRGLREVEERLVGRDLA